jgi:hypothetical protein
LAEEEAPNSIPEMGYQQRQDISPSEFALTVYIQFSLIISFLVINSRAMGSTSTIHDDGHIGINSVKVCSWID